MEVHWLAPRERVLGVAAMPSRLSALREGRGESRGHGGCAHLAWFRLPPTTSSWFRLLLEQVGDLVGCGRGCRTLVREALSELTTVALSPGFELNDVTNADATVATDTMGDDLSAVEELVQVRAAHAEALSDLRGGERVGVGENDEFVAVASASSEAQQCVTKLGSGLGRGEVLEHFKLVGRDLRGFYRLQGAQRLVAIDRLDVTDDSTGSSANRNLVVR